MPHLLFFSAHPNPLPEGIFRLFPKHSYVQQITVDGYQNSAPFINLLRFSIYSFLQNTLIESSSDYLENFASSEAAITANVIDDLFRDIRFATENDDIQNLILKPIWLMAL